MFEKFSAKVGHLQAITAQAKPDPAEVEASLVGVELARLDYNRSRDALARELLCRSARELPRVRRETPGSDDGRVKAIAKLFWDLTGRPEGRSEENWYRAENIVRRAAATSPC